MRLFGRQRGFESLENRLAFAGNVTTVVDGSGNLLVTGDQYANGITIQGLGYPGVFGIFAFDMIDPVSTGNTTNPATTLNGTPNGVTVVTGVTGSIIVNLGNGNNTLFAWDFNHVGHISVNTGSGNDQVVIGMTGDPMVIVGNLTINTGEGIDGVTERAIHVVGNHSITAANVTSFVDPGAANRHTHTITDSSFAGNVELRLGYRNAAVRLNNVTVAGNLNISNTLNPPTVKTRTALFFAEYDLNLVGANNLSITSDVLNDVELLNTIAGANLGLNLYGARNTALVRNGYVTGNLTASSMFTNLGASAAEFSPVDEFTVENTVVGQTLTLAASKTAALKSSTVSNVVMYGATQLVQSSLIGGNLTMNASNPSNELTRMTVSYSIVGVSLSVANRTRSNAVRLETIATTAGNLYYAVPVGVGGAGWTGQDAVILSYSTFNNADLQFGTNNDSFTATNSTVNYAIRLHGGIGTNSAIISGSTLNGMLRTNI